MKNKAKLFGQNNRFMLLPCPKCGQGMKFVKDGFNGVRLNMKRIPVPGMYMLLRTCPNPMCEWNELSGGSDD